MSVYIPITRCIYLCRDVPLCCGGRLLFKRITTLHRAQRRELPSHSRKLHHHHHHHHHSPPPQSIFQSLENHNPSNLAVKHTQSGRRFTYADLKNDIKRSRKQLLQRCSAAKLSSLQGERVAFVAENDYDSVGTVSLLFFFCYSIAQLLERLNA